MKLLALSAELRVHLRGEHRELRRTVPVGLGSLRYSRSTRVSNVASGGQANRTGV